MRVFSVPESNPEVDLDSTLLSALNILLPKLSLTLSYLPGVVYADVNEPARKVAFQQSGRARLQFSTTLRRWTFSAYADAAYTAGNVALLNQFAPSVTPASTGRTAPGTAPDAPPNLATPPVFGLTLVVPPNTTIKVGTASLGVGAGYAFTRRLSLTGAAFGSASEGFDTVSRQLSPPSWTVGGGSDLSYGLTARDSIFTRATVSYSVTDAPAQGKAVPETLTKSTIGAISEGYRHIWSPRTSGSIAAGLSVGSSEASTGANRTTFDTSAFGEGSLQHTTPIARGVIASVRASARYGLGVNQFSGGLQNQLSGVASAGLTDGDVTLTASLTGTTSVAATPTTQTVAAALVSTYQPVTYLYFFAGATASRSLIPIQTTNAAGQPVVDNGIDWTAFLGIGVTAPALTF